jgi:hypothetical protein
MPHQLNATPSINAFLDSRLPTEYPARAEAILAGACRVCLQMRPDCLSSECPTGRRCHYRELARQRFGHLNSQLNPDTHCLDCGEVLSEFLHCWQCHWPPMDPAQDKAAPQPYCNGQCGICSCQVTPSNQPATATLTK